MLVKHQIVLDDFDFYRLYFLSSILGKILNPKHETNSCGKELYKSAIFNHFVKHTFTLSLRACEFSCRVSLSYKLN